MKQRKINGVRVFDFCSLDVGKGMTRLLRFYMDGCPQHIIQRGDKRQACFAGNDDTFYLLDKLQYQRL
jgi:hypothetical protein